MVIDSDFFKGLDGLKKLKLCCFNIIFESRSMQNLVNLQYLDFSDVKLSFKDNLDNQNLFANLKSLKHLDLSRAQYTDQSFLTNCIGLKYLYLAKSKLKIYTKMFESLPYLESLDLCSSIANNGLHQSTFFGLSNLKKLNLSNIYQINIFKSNTFNELINLIDLDLSNSRIKSIDLGAFDCLSKLEILNLANNNIQKMDEQHFKGLISLKKLDVSNNPFIFKMDICQFSRKINPNELDLVIFNYNSFI